MQRLRDGEKRKCKGKERAKEKKKKRKDGFPKRREARGKTDRSFPTAPQF